MNNVAQNKKKKPFFESLKMFFIMFHDLIISQANIY